MTVNHDMFKVRPLPINPISPGERQARIDLAAAYRLAAMFGWDDLIWTHISARVPGPDHHFLINPLGLAFDEVTASNLVKIDLDGNILSETEYGINAAGFVIHSAVHAAREDAQCVMHLHTDEGMALSALKEGLLPLTQHSMRFYGHIGYHDYEGIALDLDERERLVADLGTHDALILRNHGTLTVGRSVAEAFIRMNYLEKSGRAQLMAMNSGRELSIVSHEVATHTAAQFHADPGVGGRREWPSLLRKLDREDPSYRDL